MYYPLSEISQPRYTSGYEYSVKYTGQAYSGYYFATSDGKYFSGKEPSLETKELIKISELKSKNYEKTSFLSDIIIPTEKDYETGHYSRYIIKRVNSGMDTIREVSYQDYVRSTQDPLYNQAEISWSISGELEDKKHPSGTVIPGVFSKNKAAVEALDKKIPGAKNFFRNLIQYHK